MPELENRYENASMPLLFSSLQLAHQLPYFVFFFFNDTATTEIYTLSLHDALPISPRSCARRRSAGPGARPGTCLSRSEEHTSELQSRSDLVCRLLLEKKKKNDYVLYSETWKDR